MFHSCEQILLT